MDKCKLILSDNRVEKRLRCNVVDFNYDETEIFSLKVNIRGVSQPHKFILGHVNKNKPINVDIEFENYGIKASIKGVYIVSFENYILEIKTSRK